MSIPALTPGLSRLKRVFVGTTKIEINNTTNKKSNIDDEFYQENEHFHSKQNPRPPGQKKLLAIMSAALV